MAQNQNQNQGYQPIDESKVNWDKIEEKFGISKEVLEKTGAKDNMLNFGKSGLLDVTMLIYDQKVKAAARLQLTRLPDGTYSALPHFVRKEQKLENAEYMGYTFTKEDAKALKETGNLGKVVPLFNVRDNTMQQCFVSLDKQTNELVHYPLSKLHLRDSIGNIKFTPEEMELLRQGGAVKNKLFENDKGRKFVVDCQVNADRKNVAFVPGSSRQEVEQEQSQKARLNWTNEAGSIETLIRIVDENGGFTIIPEMHLPFLTDRQRENVRRIEGDYLSQRRVSLYIREDYIRQSMLNTITKTLLRFMPEGMMEERIMKYGVKL